MDVERAESFGAAVDEQRRGHHPREPLSLKFVEDRDRKFAHRTARPVSHRMHRADRRAPGAFAADRAPCDMVVAVNIGEFAYHRIGQHWRGREKAKIARFRRQFGDAVANQRRVVGGDRAQAHRGAVVERAMHRDILDPRLDFRHTLPVRTGHRSLPMLRR